MHKVICQRYVKNETMMQILSLNAGKIKSKVICCMCGTKFDEAQSPNHKKQEPNLWAGAEKLQTRSRKS
jgi:hypothetical protein